jgi:hypothetical protein
MEVFKRVWSQAKGKNAGARLHPRHRDGIMKRILAIICLGTISAWADTTFWQQMTPEERKTAGVDQLTTGQQQVLDLAAARFAREGARKEVEQAREQAKVEAKAEAKAEHKSKWGLFSREDAEMSVRARLAEDFRGWSGHTVFKLDNGQVWMQSDIYDNYYSPPLKGVEIEIRQSSLNSWKLYLVSDGRWVRVKRVR